VVLISYPLSTDDPDPVLTGAAEQLGADLAPCAHRVGVHFSKQGEVSLVDGILVRTVVPARRARANRCRLVTHASDDEGLLLYEKTPAGDPHGTAAGGLGGRVAESHGDPDRLARLDADLWGGADIERARPSE